VLKSCPFCGSKELVECAEKEPEPLDKTFYQKRWIECLDCGTRGPYVFWDSFNKCDKFAEAEWNQRIA
jgi:transcription elongation factor Elf1